MTRRIAISLAAAAAAAAPALPACGGGGNGTPDAQVCDRVDLSAAAADYALPTGYPQSAFGALSASPVCGVTGLPSYVTTDLTGDGVPDLVVTSKCGDATVGDTRWIVHPGGATGFGAAQDWALPTGYPQGSFAAAAASRVCGGTGVPSYALADLTGDGVPDLVVTSKCGDATAGDTRWIVHPGGASGFGAAEDWALPSGYPQAAFAALAASPVCGASGLPSYALADATGDGHPDLIVTSRCGDATVGDSRWIVHAGGGSGFGAARDWTLPTGYPQGSFDAIARSPVCGVAGVPTYAAIDLDGDRRLDLVVTSRCADAATGDTRWILHRGQDGGFAAAADYALPAGYPTSAFVAVAASPVCGSTGVPTYALADATGDGRADLIVTSRCGDAATGDTSWIVHASGADGFAAATTVALPSGYAAGSFAQLAASRTCGAAGLPSYVFLDLGGDHRPDLVVTSRCGDAATGDTRWLVHTSACAP